MSEPEEILRNFTVGEIGEVLKSKDNLIYLFQISGRFIRFLLAPQEYVHARISEGCNDIQEKIDDNGYDSWHFSNSSYQRGKQLNHLERHQDRPKNRHLLSGCLCENKQDTRLRVHV